jgi:hypothetical protein
MIALLLYACATASYRTPEQNEAECADDPLADCCSDAECGEDQLCDYDYMCSPAPDGGVQCSTPAGDRECHDYCIAGEDCADPDQVCTAIERALGGDQLQEVWACI